MARKQRLTAEIVTIDKSSAVIGKVQGRFSKLAGFLKANMLASVAGVGLAFAGLAKVMRSSIGAAQVQEDAIRKLDAALAPLGESAKAVSVALQAQASALQQSTKFGDESIIQAQALIASFVKEEDAIKGATAATLDFATGTGIDLVGAAALVSKTLGSSTNALTRYGIEVEGAVGSSERLESLTRGISKVFGGQAAAAVDTFSGRMQQLKNVIGDAAEGIGFYITKNEAINKAIETLTSVISNPRLIPGFETLTGLFVVGQKVGTAFIATLDAVAAKLGFVSTALEKYISFFKIDVILDFIKAQGQLALANRDLAAQDEALAAAFEKKVLAILKGNTAIAEAVPKYTAGAAAVRKLGDAAADVGQPLSALNATVKETEAAFAKLDAASQILGSTTSVQLEKQILDITIALEAQAEALGRNSDEYIKLEEDAGASIGKLRDRIENLKDGFGDLRTATDDTVGSTAQFGEVAKTAGDKTKDLASALGLAADEQRRLRAEQETSSNAGGLSPSGLSGSSFPVTIGGGTFTTVVPRTQVDATGRVTLTRRVA